MGRKARAFSSERKMVGVVACFVYNGDGRLAGCFRVVACACDVYVRRDGESSRR